jgi:hypothetical protein
MPAYVLIRADDCETVREILEDERRQKAIRTTALKNVASMLTETA